MKPIWSFGFEYIILPQAKARELPSRHAHCLPSNAIRRPQAQVGTGAPGNRGMHYSASTPSADPRGMIHKQHVVCGGGTKHDSLMMR